MLDLPRKAFYIARHAKSVANAFNLIAGHEWDAELVEEGIGQALNLAELVSLLDEPPSIIHHSPLKRAADTAQIVGSKNDIVLNPIHDLKEQGLGSWNRRTWAELSKHFLNAEDPPDGESNQSYGVRIIQGLKEGLLRSEGTPLFVSHGGSFYALARLTGCFNGMSEIGNCQLFHYRPIETDGWAIDCLRFEGKSIIAASAPFCPTRLP